MANDPFRLPMQGWMCPKCGSIYNMFVERCSRCIPGIQASNSTDVRSTPVKNDLIEKLRRLVGEWEGWRENTAALERESLNDRIHTIKICIGDIQRIIDEETKGG